MGNIDLQHHGIKGMRWGRRRYQNKDGSLTPAGKKRRAAEEDVSSLSDEELRSRINRLNLERRYVNLSKPKGNNILGTAGKISSMGSDGNKIGKNVKKYRDGKKPTDLDLDDAVTDFEAPKGKGKGKGKSEVDLVGQGLKVTSGSLSAANKIKNIVDDNKTAKRVKPKLESMNDDELRKVVNRMDMEQQYSNLKKESVSRGKVSAGQVLSIAGDVLAVGASATAIVVAINNLKKG